MDHYLPIPMTGKTQLWKTDTLSWCLNFANLSSPNQQAKCEKSAQINNWYGFRAMLGVSQGEDSTEDSHKDTQESGPACFLALPRVGGKQLIVTDHLSNLWKIRIRPLSLSPGLQFVSLGGGGKAVNLGWKGWNHRKTKPLVITNLRTKIFRL